MYNATLLAKNTLWSSRYKQGNLNALARYYAPTSSHSKTSSCPFAKTAPFRRGEQARDLFLKTHARGLDEGIYSCCTTTTVLPPAQTLDKVAFVHDIAPDRWRVVHQLTPTVSLNGSARLRDRYWLAKVSLSEADRRAHNL